MRGPKEKRERALGEHLNLKGERCSSPKCAMVRKPYPPGMHGPRGRRKTLSDFGRQIREKQKVKLTYGLDERNLRQLLLKAQKRSGSTVSRVVESLESRLDNVAFRLGFAASRTMTRQFITHGHILVNGRRVRSPGYAVRVGDSIRVREASLSKAAFRELKELLKKHEAPPWLELVPEALEGRVRASPVDITSPFEMNLLVESFSK